MTRPENKGFTLIEVLVSFTILLLAMGMIVVLFVSSMSLFRRQSGKSDSYRNCMMLVEKFQLSILNSQMETLTVALDGGAVSWQEFEEAQPFSGTTGDARMSPDFGVIYWDDTTQKVYYTRAEGEGGAPDEPAILDLATLDLARNVSSKASRVLASKIVQFNVTDKDGNVEIIEPPLRMSMTCEVDTNGQETNDVEVFQLSTSVTPRSRRW